MKLRRLPCAAAVLACVVAAQPAAVAVSRPGVYSASRLGVRCRIVDLDRTRKLGGVDIRADIKLVNNLTRRAKVVGRWVVKGRPNLVVRAAHRLAPGESAIETRNVGHFHSRPEFDELSCRG